MADLIAAGIVGAVAGLAVIGGQTWWRARQAAKSAAEFATDKSEIERWRDAMHRRLARSPGCDE